MVFVLTLIVATFVMVSGMVCFLCAKSLDSSNDSSTPKRVCPECGMQNPQTARFCQDCGTEMRADSDGSVDADNASGADADPGPDEE